jgi:biopolymer transport protein ExbB
MSEAVVDPNVAAETMTQVAQTAVASGGEQELSMLQWFSKFMIDGGLFMWVILGIWCAGVGILIIRYFRLREYDIDAPSFMAEVKKFVLNNEVNLAIQLCGNSTSLLSKVFKEGLKRANQSRQQIQDVLEAGMIDANGKAESQLNWVALLANFSTLFGLLGTIQGLIISFSAVAGVDPSEKAKLLAVGISTAMNTTALGLVAAISLLFFHTYLVNKSQKIISDMDEYSMRLIDLFSTRKTDEYMQEDLDREKSKRGKVA